MVNILNNGICIYACVALSFSLKISSADYIAVTLAFDNKLYIMIHLSNLLLILVLDEYGLLVWEDSESEEDSAVL